MRSGVVLDVLGTVVRDPFHDVMPAFFGLTFADLLRLKHPTAWIDFELGRLTESEFLDRFFIDGRRFDHAAFKEAVFSAWSFLPGMEDVVDALATSGRLLGFASNYPIWSEELDRRLGLAARADFLFLSWRDGVRKPDAAAFGLLASRVATSPSQVWFVDDAPANVVAAERAGFRGHRFVDRASLPPAVAPIDPRR